MPVDRPDAAIRCDGMRAERRISLSRFPWFVRGFGLLFASFGTYGVIAMLFGIGHMTISINDGPPRPATPADAWLPGIFVLVGLGVALVRYSVVLDAQRRMHIKTAGWGPWLKRTEKSLATATSIDIGTAVERGSGSGRYTAIPVQAVRSSGVDELAEPRTSAAARKLAQQIAKALDLPVGPGLTGSPILRPAEDVDLPVSEVVQPDLADLRPPPDTGVTTSELQRGIEIRFPMVRIGFAALALGIVVPTLFIGTFWWFWWRPGLVEPASKSTLMWLFMMAPVLIGLCYGLVMVGSTYRAGLFGSRIQVDSEGGLRAAGRTTTAESIRSLEVMPGTRLGGGLKVVLDTSEFVIARGQSTADLHFIRALILQHLRSQSRSAVHR